MAPRLLSAWSLKAILWRILYKLQHLPLPGLWRLNRIAKQTLQNCYIPVSYLNTFKVWIHPYNAMDREIFKGEIYESETIRIIQAFVSEGFSYVDIGANIGLHLIAATNARVSLPQLFFGFEPEPTIFNVLEKNINSNNLQFVRIENCALANYQGEAKLFVSTTRNKGNHSLLEREGNSETVNVEVKTLDSFKPWLGNLPLITKIDVEGSELLVLKGGQSILSEAEELAFIIEFEPTNLKRANVSPTELMNEVLNLGCKVYVINQQGLIAPMEAPLNKFANILAVKGRQSHLIAEKFSLESQVIS